MTEGANPFSKPEREENRLGFIADLAFVFCVVWLALWRSEMSGAVPGSIWTSWWPAFVLAALLVVALVIGLVQRRPRGFLPYTLRWFFLTASLVLPVWIAFSLADAGDAPLLTVEAAATELRASAESARTAAKTLEERREAEAAVGTAEATERLAAALDAAETRGIELPKRDLLELGIDPAAIAQLPPKSKTVLEQAAGLAAMLDSGQPPPPGVSDLLHEFGLDNPMVQKALIGLAAATLGPLFGLSPVLIEAILTALISDGFSFGSVINVALSLATSTTKSGKVSARKFRSNYKAIKQGADVVDKLVKALEARGAPRDSVGMKLLRETTQPDVRDPACDNALAAVKDLAAEENRLRRVCAHMSWDQIQTHVRSR
jgi:hypothetical protein